MLKDKIRILIADDDKDTCEILGTFFDTQLALHVCAVAHNGEDAIKMIYESTPDVIILDIVMPGKDGICVLEEINSHVFKKRPLVIITSASGQEIVMRKAVALGANFFIMKPYSLDVLLSRVYMVSGQDPDLKRIKDGETFESSSLENIVAKAVVMIGVPTQLLGYRYINLALHILMTRSMPCSISKNIYAVIGAEYSTNTDCVERAIRQALHKAFAAKTEFMLELMNYGSLNLEKCPSNGRFLTLAAAYIKLKNGFIF